MDWPLPALETSLRGGPGSGGALTASARERPRSGTSGSTGARGSTPTTPTAHTPPLRRDMHHLRGHDPDLILGYDLDHCTDFADFLERVPRGLTPWTATTRLTAPLRCTLPAPVLRLGPVPGEGLPHALVPREPSSSSAKLVTSEMVRTSWSWNSPRVGAGSPHGHALGRGPHEASQLHPEAPRQEGGVLRPPPLPAGKVRAGFWRPSPHDGGQSST